jgi:hypothetical protein
MTDDGDCRRCKDSGNGGNGGIYLFLPPLLACLLPSFPDTHPKLSSFLLGDGDASFGSFFFIFACLLHYKSMNQAYIKLTKPTTSSHQIVEASKPASSP